MFPRARIREIWGVNMTCVAVPVWLHHRSSNVLIRSPGTIRDSGTDWMFWCSRQTRSIKTNISNNKVMPSNSCWIISTVHWHGEFPVPTSPTLTKMAKNCWGTHDLLDSRWWGPLRRSKGRRQEHYQRTTLQGILNRRAISKCRGQDDQSLLLKYLSIKLLLPP